MIRPFVLAAALLTMGASRTTLPEERTEKVAAGEVSTTVMRLASEALAFCPVAGASPDIEGLIRSAEQAGWPQFTNDPDADNLAERGMSASGVISRISRRSIQAEDGSDSGWLELRLLHVARVVRADGTVSIDWHGCGLRVVPRREGPPRDDEMASATKAMADFALADAGRLRVSPPPPRERTTLWTFHDGGDGWRFVRPDFDDQGRIRTMRIFNTPNGLLYGIYDREDLPSEGCNACRR